MYAPSHVPGMRPLIFMGRWLQVPLYTGLIVAQRVYAVLFLKKVWPRVARLTTHTHPQHFHHETTAPQAHN
jgi:uncharacterized membrane protein YqhA